ncbi:DNA-binding transcriptional MocR family regulator [Marinomonas aquiplantarum]|uniref:DNA-binding transcriptional MocR family regulator n=1 Tax=Marinomonas aquiplantarum TaxID=491951 RepID=A0A366D895_9GAMM|nr:DNA-binding transcriptional MocR family regulator [Marinomonas aquiplantarum]
MIDNSYKFIVLKRYKAVADFLYKGVVDWFLEQVSQDVLNPGDKMPSLRALSKQLGLSLNTVIHGYELLTKDGWIESRPKSGYFVCHRSEVKPALLLAGESQHVSTGQETKSAWACLAHHGALVDQANAYGQSSSKQEDDALPVLGKGHLAVREVVNDYLKDMGIKSRASQLWLGRSPLAMLTQSIQTLTKKGDSVLVITPCDPRLTSTLQSLGRRVITISAGDRGVDLDLAIRCLRDEPIKLIVLPGQFAFPAGQLISNLSLRRWLAIIEETQLPVIEWDLCSHLAYRSGPLLTYKSLDQSDHIVYIGGVESKTSEMTMAWCLPGRHHEVLDGAFLAADMALNDVQQACLSDMLKINSKASVIRRARDVWANAERIKAYLDEQLGDQISLVSSKGGMALWMRLAKPVNKETMPALIASFRHVIVPGGLLSPEQDADYWLALNVTVDEVTPVVSLLKDYLLPDLGASEAASDSSLEAISASSQAALAEQNVPELDQGQTTTEAERSSDQEDVQPSQGNSTSEEERKTPEPLYNPMLDLINHDFG